MSFVHAVAWPLLLAALPQDHAGASSAQLLEAMKVDSDVWADADMPSVCEYLRGCRDLTLPPVFRDVLGLRQG